MALRVGLLRRAGVARISPLSLHISISNKVPGRFSEGRIRGHIQVNDTIEPMSEEIEEPNSDTLCKIIEALSPARMNSFLIEAGGNPQKTLDLYQWSQSMASASWTIFSYVEILLRNAIDRELSKAYDDANTRIPWFLRTDVLRPEDRDRLVAQMSKLPDTNLSADQVIAHTHFGFWSHMFSSTYASLWDTCLNRVFRGGEMESQNYEPPFPRRKDVSRELEAVRLFRNRMAHQETLIHVRIPVEIRRLLSLAHAISPQAATWMSKQDSWKQIYETRPVLVTDTVVVKSDRARQVFLKSLEKCGVGVFTANSGAFFRDVKYLGFYDGEVVHPEFPEIIDVRDNVECSTEHAAVLKESEDRTDRKLGRIIEWLLDNEQIFSTSGEKTPTRQIFLLSEFSEKKGRTLESPIERVRTGRGSGFTRKGKRYVSMHRLETARNTSDF